MPARLGLPLTYDVEIAEVHAAFIGVLQRGQDPHQGGLAGAVRSEQAVHSCRNGERYVPEGLDAVAITLGDTADGEFHRRGDAHFLLKVLYETK